MIKKIAMLIGEGFQDSEAAVPFFQFRDEGFPVTVVGPKAGRPITGKHGKETFRCEQSVTEADPSQFSALFLPGGKSPENLRDVEGALDFVKYFLDREKPIVAICHGPQLLMWADGLRGRELTAYSGIADDLTRAGATFKDRPVVIDGNLVTSRNPGDLGAFCEAALSVFREELTPAR